MTRTTATRRLIPLAAAVFLLALSSGSAHADTPDYTFRVPVKLTNIPADITEVVVTASVYTDSGGASVDSMNRRTAHGYKRITFNGSLDTTAVVTFNLKPGKTMAEGKAYVVRIKMASPGATLALPVCSYTMKTSGPYPHDTSKPCVDRYQGTL